MWALKSYNFTTHTKKNPTETTTGYVKDRMKMQCPRAYRITNPQVHLAQEKFSVQK